MAFAAVLGLSAADGARADGETPLSLGNRALDFLSWRDAGPSQRFDDLSLPAGRLEAYRAEELPYVERLRRYAFDFRANGMVHERFVTARLYLNRAGVRDGGELSAWVDAHGEHLVIDQAYTLREDGSRELVDPGTVQVTVPAEDRVFTDYVRAVIPFPALAPGTVAVLGGTRVHQPSEVALPWSRIMRPKVFVPIEEFQVDITWEAGRAEPVWRTDLDVMRCQELAPRHVRCIARELAPSETDPHVSYRDALPSLALADAASWSSIADTMRELVEGSLSGDQLQGLARELTAGDATDDERVESIHQFVTEQIRYVGLEQGIGGIVPRPTSLTLARRYGDCKDMTTLFVDLARHAGLDAYPVLSASRRYDSSKLLLPAAAYFDHMIACVALTGGEERCLDLTDPHSPSRALQPGMQGTVRLDLRPGVSSPSTLAEARYAWELHVDTDGQLNDDGSMDEGQVRIYAGSFGAWLRGVLAGLDAKERERWNVDEYRNEVSHSAEPTIELSGIDAPVDDVVVRSSTRYDSFFSTESPADVRDVESWLGHMTRTFDSDNEHYDYRFPGFRYRGTTTYLLPWGMTLASPGPRIEYQSEYGRMLRVWQLTGRTVEVHTELDIERRHVVRDELERFNAFLDAIESEIYLDFRIRRESRR